MYNYFFGHNLLIIALLLNQIVIINMMSNIVDWQVATLTVPSIHNGGIIYLFNNSKFCHSESETYCNGIWSCSQQFCLESAIGNYMAFIPYTVDNCSYRVDDIIERLPDKNSYYTLYNLIKIVKYGIYGIITLIVFVGIVTKVYDLKYMSSIITMLVFISYFVYSMVTITALYQFTKNQTTRNGDKLPPFLDESNSHLLLILITMKCIELLLIICEMCNYIYYESQEVEYYLIG